MEVAALRAGRQPEPQDRALIEDLYARYNLAVDLGEADAWVRCFTPHGTFTITGHGEWSRAADIPVEELRGHDQLRTFMGTVTDERRVRHWTTNLVLRLVDGDDVAAISLMTVWDLAAARAGEVVLTGVMRDRLVLDGDAWLFASRHLTLDK